MNNELAESIVSYMNDLLKLDRPAVASLIANHVPCNEKLADHPTCQVGTQHGGCNVGLLGLLNGLCGVDENSLGGIIAVYDNPEGEANTNEWYDLVRFELRQPLKAGG